MNQGPRAAEIKYCPDHRGFPARNSWEGLSSPPWLRPPSPQFARPLAPTRLWQKQRTSGTLSFPSFPCTSKTLLGLREARQAQALYREAPGRLGGPICRAPTHILPPHLHTCTHMCSQIHTHTHMHVCAHTRTHAHLPSKQLPSPDTAPWS